nr:extracellular solute-binding protein [Propionicimonas sp.]
MSNVKPVRRGRALLSVALAAGLALGGCSAAGSSPSVTSSSSGSEVSGNLDVRVYADWPFVKANAEAFMKEHQDAHITVGAIDNDTLRQSGGRMFTSNDAPDVVSYTVAQDLFGQWTKANALQPVDDVWKAGGLDAVTSDSVSTLVTAADGQKYAVPLGLTIAPVLFYNKALWEKAGATAPGSNHQFASLDEFNQALAKVKASGATPMAVTGGTLSQLIFNSTFASSCGASYDSIVENYKQGNNGSYSDPCIVKALSTFQDWIKNGYIEEGMPSQTQQTTQALFENGKAGSWVQGSWTPPVFEPSFEYDWALLPSLGSDQSPIAVAPDSFLIPAKAKNPTLAKAFIQYMVSKSTLEAGMGRVPAQSGLDMTKVTKGNAIEASLSDAATSSSSNVIAIWDTVAPATVLTALQSDVVPGLVNGSMTPEQAAAHLQSTLEQYKAANG